MARDGGYRIERATLRCEAETVPKRRDGVAQERTVGMTGLTGEVGR